MLDLDYVTETAFNRPRGIRWAMTQRLEDIDFADDICMLSQRLQDANSQMDRLNTTAPRVGLNIYPGKTKVMQINAPTTRRFGLISHTLKRLKSLQ